MYNYYCTFGEQKHTNNDFMSLILNMLRESLEGILTNSEMFYKDVNQLNSTEMSIESFKCYDRNSDR